MIRGLIARIAIFELGGIPLVSLVHILDIPAGIGGVAVMVYALAGASYLAHYCVKREDEAPVLPTRR